MVALDLGVLRASPWISGVLSATQGPERAATVQQHGFDELADMDALVIVKIQGAVSETASLQLMRGRFDRLRVEAAFRKRHLDAQAHDIMGVSVLDTGEEALAVVAPRILATGPSTAVRAVIELHRGRGHPIGDEPWLGRLREGIAAGGRLYAGGVAMELVVNAGSALAAQMSGLVEGVILPAQVIAVAEVGSGLQVGILGVAASRRAGDQLARQIEGAVRSLAQRPSVKALGLGPMMGGARIEVRGPQVLVTAGLQDAERAVVAERLAIVAAIMAKKKAEPLPAPDP